MNSSIGGHLHTLMPNHTDKFIDNNRGESKYKVVGLFQPLPEKQPDSCTVDVEVIKEGSLLVPSGSVYCTPKPVTH